MSPHLAKFIFVSPYRFVKEVSPICFDGLHDVTGLHGFFVGIYAR